MTEEEKLLKAAELAEQSGDLETAKKALSRVKEIRNSKTFAGSIKEELTVDSTRPLELMARSGVNGITGMMDVLTGPIKAGLNQFGFDYGTNTYSAAGNNFLNSLGVAQPESTGEKVVSKATEFLSSGAPFVKGGSLLAGSANPVISGTGKTLASNPLLQSQSMASAGAASEGVKEQGGGPWSQFGAGLLGSLAPSGAKAITGNAKGLLPSSKVDTDSVIQSLGVDLSGLPAKTKASIHKKVAEALEQGDLSEPALRRLIDFEKTNTIPTKASLTLNNIDKTQQKNLAKIGANSTDETLQQLSNVEANNNRTIISNLDDLAGGQQFDPYAGGQSAIAPVTAKRQGLLEATNNLYKSARDTDGRALPLDRAQFVNRVDELLVDSNRIAFLPKEIKETINQIGYGQIKVKEQMHEVPFNVDTIDTLKTMLASAQRGADGNTSHALKMVRQALDETQIQGGASDEAIQAFDKARASNFELKKWEESTPAIKAIADGVAPDQFMDKFIIGKSASFDDVSKLAAEIKTDPAAFNAVKNQLAAWIKTQAVSGKADEVANVSSSAFNTALKKIGDKKLSLFFSSDEIAAIKANQRVSSYEQYQPVGSAINNSNSGTTVQSGLLDFMGASPTMRLLGQAAKIPYKARADRKQAGLLMNPPLLSASRKRPPNLLALPLGIGAATE